MCKVRIGFEGRATFGPTSRLKDLVHYDKNSRVRVRARVRLRLRARARVKVRIRVGKLYESISIVIGVGVL